MTCTCSNQLQPHDRMSVCPVPPCLDHDQNGGPGSDQCMNCYEYFEETENGS